MFLARPSFPVSVGLSDAEGKVSALLEKRHWKNFSFLQSAVVYIPCWFFSFDIFEEQEKTKLLSSGSNCLNAFSREFDSELSNLNSLDTVSKTSDVDEDIESRVLDSKVSEKEAREIILVKVASMEGVSRKNVILSGLELFYAPVWVVNVDLGEREVSLRMNATTGKIINGDSIPMREKGFSELTSEAINELSTPKGWLDYSAGILGSFSKSVSGNAPQTDEISLSNPDIQLLLLGILALLVVIWFFYF